MQADARVLRDESIGGVDVAIVPDFLNKRSIGVLELV
jgi:hypothetical protein